MARLIVSVSARLRAGHADLWERCYEHPFVQAIGRGDLAPEAFRRFLVQDYLFLIEYAKVLAYGSAKAPDLESQTWFSRLQMATLEVEMDLHRKTCAEWGIGSDELETAEALPTTLAYTGFLVRTAESGDIGELCAALLPCLWGYADTGTRLLQRGLPPDEHYAAWIRSYSDPDYTVGVDWLRGFTDELGCSPEAYARWSEIFGITLGHELAFWEMAWTGEKPATPPL